MGHGKTGECLPAVPSRAGKLFTVDSDRFEIGAGGRCALLDVRPEAQARFLPRSHCSLDPRPEPALRRGGFLPPPPPVPRASARLRP